MSTAIVVAVISGGVSLAAVVLSLASARNVARLNSELEERRRARTKEEQAEDLRARYRDPLLNAALDLKSRLYNIIVQDFLGVYGLDRDEVSHTYAIENTLYLLAEYFGWVEIMRREIQFLDLGENESNRKWVDALERVRTELARDDIDPTLHLFRGNQRAIGELMTVPVASSENGRRNECLGYACFTTRLEDPEFARWFRKLELDLEALAQGPDVHRTRPLLLHNALADVLQVLDPEGSRFPPERRARLSDGASYHVRRPRVFQPPST